MIIGRPYRIQASKCSHAKTILAHVKEHKRKKKQVWRLEEIRTIECNSSEEY